MAGDVQHEEPVTELLRAATAVVPAWLRRITTDACRRAGRAVGESERDAIDRMVAETSASVLSALGELLATDVDEQRTTPLTLFRDAVSGPTALLDELGVTPPPSDAFGGERFPDDRFGLGPAAWSDIDDQLHQPGIVWGAWKAMTVLSRRRDDGLR